VPLAEHIQISASLLDTAAAWLAEPTPTETPGGVNLNWTRRNSLIWPHPGW
jgi:hypothetical protein